MHMYIGFPCSVCTGTFAQYVVVASIASWNHLVAMPYWWGWEAVANRASPDWLHLLVGWMYFKFNSRKAMVWGTSRYILTYDICMFVLHTYVP